MTLEDSTVHLPIATYRAELAPAFERLNRVWLEEHGILEPADLEYLRDPEGLIVATGGQVFFALDGDLAVGTCAAIRISESTFELAKLSVDPAAQGRGLGRLLCRKVIDFARDAGASDMFLTSHTALTQAIRLYELLGFRHAPVPADVRYASANVYMTLSLR